MEFASASDGLSLGRKSWRKEEDFLKKGIPEKPFPVKIST